MSDIKQKVSIILSVNNSLLRDGIARIISAKGYKVVASASVLDADVLSQLKPDENTLLVLGGSVEPDSKFKRRRFSLWLSFA